MGMLLVFLLVMIITHLNFKVLVFSLFFSEKIAAKLRYNPKIPFISCYNAATRCNHVEFFSYELFRYDILVMSNIHTKSSNFTK